MMDWEIRKILTFVKCSIHVNVSIQENAVEAYTSAWWVWNELLTQRIWQLEKMRYHTIILFVGHSNTLDKDSDERKRMFIQNFGVTNKEYYGTLWHFL